MPYICGMKTTRLFILLLIAFFAMPTFGATITTNGDDKTNQKNIQKQRAKDKEADQKYLAQSKKAFWKAQSKQVKKTIKQANKRNKSNRTSNNYLLY